LVLELHGRGVDWEDARDRLEIELGHYSFVHTINNAAAVTAALLWGEADFTRTTGLAVQAGWDTDCNGATAGSAFGALHGTAAIPSRWTEPLADHIRSAIFDFDHSRISDLALRTVAQRHAAPVSAVS
jgi:ADP-ribosylglycohydrolase